MIKLELEVTIKQLAAIAAVLADDEKTVDPNIADNSHIESKIPVGEGGTKTGSEDESQATGSTGAAFAAETTVEDLNKTTAMNSHLEADTPPPPPPSDVQLAKSTTGEMIPWDARIHSSSKKINANGTWKMLKGVDRENLVLQVEAELVALMAGKPSTGQTTSPPAEQQSVSNVDTSPTTSESASDNTPPPPSSLNNDEEAEPKVISTFPELLPLVTGAKGAGTLTDEMINTAIAELGLTKFGELAVRTDLVKSFAEKVGLA